MDAGTLAAELLGQRYDMAITGWTGLGADPNDDWLWTAEHDRPGSDFNFASYHNGEVIACWPRPTACPAAAPKTTRRSTSRFST